jgi:hypothetical protein
MPNRGDGRASREGQLIPGQHVCAAAVLGFCLAARCAMLPGAGNAEGEHLAAAVLPVWERTLPLHGHATALALGIMQRWLRRAKHGDRETGIVVYITALSTVRARAMDIAARLRC